VVQAEASLRRALELNPELPLAHNLLAQIDIDRGRAREAMVRLLRQAGRRSTDPELFAGLVHACRYCGLLGASLHADARARRLDPSIRTSVVHTYWMLRQYESVLAARVEAPIVMAFAMVGLGRMSDALQLLTEKEGQVAPRVRQMIGALRALLEGRDAEAIVAIRAIASGFRDAEGLYYMARQLARAGAADEAVALIRSATAEGFFCAPLMQSDEWLDSLRNLPAFLDVLRLAEHEHALAVAAFTEAGGDQILGAD